MTGDDKSVNESHCWPGARDEINGKTERERPQSKFTAELCCWPQALFSSSSIDLTLAASQLTLWSKLSVPRPREELIMIQEATPWPRRHSYLT